MPSKLDTLEQLSRVLTILINRFVMDRDQMTSYIQMARTHWESKDTKELGETLNSRFNVTIQRLETVQKVIDNNLGESRAGDKITQAIQSLEKAYEWRGNVYHFVPLFYKQYVDRLEEARKILGLMAYHEMNDQPVSGSETTAAPKPEPNKPDKPARQKPALSRPQLTALFNTITNTLKTEPKPPNYGLNEFRNFSKNLDGLLEQLQSIADKFKPEFGQVLRGINFKLNLFEQRYQDMSTRYGDKLSKVQGEEFGRTIELLLDARVKLTDLRSDLGKLILK